MKGLKRSLIYWGYLIEKYFFTMIVTMIGMGIIMSMMNRKSELEMVALYMPMMGIIFMMSQAMSNAHYNIPQALSFGATRREILIGMQIFIHVATLQTILLTFLGVTYLPNPTELEAIKLFQIYAVLLLFSCGAGNGICAATMRYGNKIGVSVYMFFIILMIFLAVGIVISGFADLRNALVAFCGWGAIAAVILDIIMIGVCSKVIKNYEVRV